MQNEELKKLVQQYNLLPLVPLTGNSKQPYCLWSEEVNWVKSIDGLDRKIFNWVNRKGENKKGTITGYGLLTGEKSGITIVDLDINHKDGVNGVDTFTDWMLDTLEWDDIETIRATLTIETPRGGKHLYFKYVEGVKNVAGILSGVDVRNDGGQAPIAYSTRKLEGKILEYKVINDGEIEEMPEALKQLLKGKNLKEKIDIDPLDDMFLPLKGMVEGEGRNNALNKTLFQYAKQHNIKDFYAIKALALMVNTEYFAEPEEGFLKTAESVYRKIANDAEDHKRDVKFMPLADSIEKEPIKEYGFIINRLLYENGINLISGDPKTFKTYVAIDIAIGVATGTTSMGHTVLKKGKVLFISTEFDTRNRFINLLKGRGINDISVLNDIITFIYDSSIDTFQWKKDFELLEKELDKYKPKLLVLDPLSYIFDGDITKGDEVGEFFKELKLLVRKYNTSVLILHHNNRMKEIKKINNISGSSAISRFADSIILLEKFDEEEKQDINKSDEELDSEAKPIKLIKGPYRHGNEGYKYYTLNFKIGKDKSEIVTERLDTKTDFNGTDMKLTPDKRKLDIENKILYAVQEGKLNRNGFKFDDVKAVINNIYDISARSFINDLRAVLKNMVDNASLKKDKHSYIYEGL